MHQRNFNDIDGMKKLMTGMTVNLSIAEESLEFVDLKDEESKEGGDAKIGALKRMWRAVSEKWRRQLFSISPEETWYSSSSVDGV